MKVVMGVEIPANITHGFEGNASEITRTEALTPSLMKNSSGNKLKKLSLIFIFHKKNNLFFKNKNVFALEI